MPSRRFGLLLILGGVLAAVVAPFLAPHSPDRRFPDLLNVPPTFPQVVDDSGGWHAPFIYSWTIADQRSPFLLLGSDSYGRDGFSRLLYGARVSMGLSIIAALGSILIGALIGAVAGYRGGATDDLLMRITDAVMVLPAMYVVLALRSALPLVLESSAVFVLLAVIFAVVGAPFVSRGVRGIIRSERHQEYAVAAESLGASHTRLLARHLLPATWGFIAVQMTMLVPAFIMGEATLSFVGLGFPEPVASWGTMLRDASNVRTFVDFPWLLSPAAAMFLVVLGLNLVFQGKREDRIYDRLM